MENNNQEEISLIEKYRDGYRGVFWHKDDFEQQAELKEHIFENKDIYDRSKFQDALELMIYKHDASIGINWDVVDYYLETYCLKEDIDGE